MGWLDDAEQRADAATEGPWGAWSTVDQAAGDLWPWTIYVDDDNDETPHVVEAKEAYDAGDKDRGVLRAADAAFIASVREDAPRAYALVRQLGEALTLTDTDPFSASTADKIDAALAAFREATEDRP